MRDEQLLTRRRWLRATTAAAGAAFLVPLSPAGARAGTAGERVAGGAAADAQGVPATKAAAIATPDEALRALQEGNRRFAQGQTTNPNRTLKRLQELGTKQQPFAAILACADSRVPVEILFDQGFGDLFVARVAGNIATSELIGSLEYSSQILGSKLVLVLGHTGCGAVSATMKAGEVPGQIGSLYPHIYPAVDRAGEKGLDTVIAENVRNQVNTLRRASPVLGGLTRGGKLDVVGGVFDFTTGLVNMV
jgi:carbonic anhydrase